MNFRDIALITSADLAKLHGYANVTSQCRAWWRGLGIKPLPGRRGVYDPKHVRERLDQAGDVLPEANLIETPSDSLVSQRRKRKHAE